MSNFYKRVDNDWLDWEVLNDSRINAASTANL